MPSRNRDLYPSFGQISQKYLMGLNFNILPQHPARLPAQLPNYVPVSHTPQAIINSVEADNAGVDIAAQGGHVDAVDIPREVPSAAPQLEPISLEENHPESVNALGFGKRGIDKCACPGSRRVLPAFRRVQNVMTTRFRRGKMLFTRLKARQKDLV